jgi:hypothetical protein
LSANEKQRIIEMSEFIKSSTLLKSYEMVIQQFDQDFEVKNN